MSKLIKAFDQDHNFKNITAVLSIDIDEAIFIYHNKVDQMHINNCSEIIHKYKKDLNVKYVYIKKDIKEIYELLTDDMIVDISSSKYLTSVLFEEALKRNYQIVYYDSEEESIKSYKTHTTIVDKVVSLTINDMVKLGGGSIIKNKMHKHVDLNDLKTTEAIIKAVEKNINKYQTFINYIQRVNTFINHKNINSLTYRISDDIKNKIIYDEVYKRIQDCHLFEIKDNTLRFMNSDIKDLFSVSGAFLENYLYIKLSKSNKFDQVLMSSIIDFSNYYNNYPITCEIDLMTIKDNHLLFISCKSNKVDTDALNEIKIHNTIFGNDLSDPVIVTLDDLNKSSPSAYLKASQLKIAVIDKTSFVNNSLVDDIISVINRTYRYERV